MFSMVDLVRPLFPLGQCVATPGALAALEEAGQMPADFLNRHVAGDWGEIDPEDKGLNEQALKDDARIFSVYQTSKGVKLWVITEADRASTCILLPDEY
jgi:hypothetical protein